MIVYYDATERVDDYGKAKFYEIVREYIAEIFERSGLEIVGGDQAIIDIYQKFSYAFVIGTLTGNPLLFEDNFFEELADPVGDWKGVEDRSGELLLSLGFSMEDIKGPLVQQDAEATMVWEESVVPNTYGNPMQQLNARRAALELFNQSVASQSGLAGLIPQLYPGRYLNHYGDDFKGLVVVCEHEGLL
ncbi:hypothetical protein BIZ78_gp257 [Erwinia phage vB_EamM_Caitlin]|uniref:hypothetical protein n=1 Tax=Erwinia phage vB_EamM_Caitlin TaxID=1883379 RepID=UPI00081CD87E|nr:hypothetical protein BIZ78_gp257 [Erwinia phage vB_EamM_Caitlin]ANZ48318.1 hypothetical protein CAITLIN_23 [Erwinia phage vB_EamM_Caitlin]